jgi:hypothetical protein
MAALSVPQTEASSSWKAPPTLAVSATLDLSMLPFWLSAGAQMGKSLQSPRLQVWFLQALAALHV